MSRKTAKTAPLQRCILAFSVCVLCSISCNDGGEQASDTDTDSDEFFDIDVSFSSEISTVAIVEWSTTCDSIENAYIEFGRSTDYGMTAPVNLEEPGFRTLLLGMKPSTEYHFRIVASDGDSTFESPDHPITTGPVPNGLPPYTVNTIDESALYGGYTVSLIYSTCQIFILDEDGDYVWWYDPPWGNCSRARMSYDGNSMLVMDLNLQMGIGRTKKITMDGLDIETVSTPNSHHDFTVLPDETVGYIRYDGDNCDDIMETDAAGNTREIFHLADAITPPYDNDCHSNSIHYWQEDDSYTISVLNKNQIIKVSRSGDLIWILGGDESTFTGNDLTWDEQHGHHVYDGKILFFNNCSPDENLSRALIYSLDEINLVSDLVWEYSNTFSSNQFGDVQHLQNGNILVTFSRDGVIHEVSPNGSLLQEISWGLGNALGYSMRRGSLYGPPPKGL